MLTFIPGLDQNCNFYIRLKNNMFVGAGQGGVGTDRISMVGLTDIMYGPGEDGAWKFRPKNTLS